MHLIVESDGSIRCVYGEELDLHRLGSLAIRRGSHVEPNVDGRWTADMNPVGGPVLGPFERRSETLDAEREWLERHWLRPPSDSPERGGSLPDSQTYVISRHLERLREIVLRYHAWFDTDNHAEATAWVMADCRMLLADLETDPEEVDRFVAAVNLRRVAPGHADDEIPPIVCGLTLDDLAENESADS